LELGRERGPEIPSLANLCPESADNHASEVTGRGTERGERKPTRDHKVAVPGETRPEERLEHPAPVLGRMMEGKATDPGERRDAKSPSPPAHLRHERLELFTRHEAVAQIHLQLLRQPSYLRGFVLGPSRIYVGQRGPECTMFDARPRCPASTPTGWEGVTRPR
jgi:hypothetical protein